MHPADGPSPPRTRIALGHLSFSTNARAFVNDVLDAKRLSAGKYTRALESRFAARHDARHGIFCNSGTSALQISLAALKERHNWSEGDEVLVPALTFIATSNIVVQNGLRPVFVDVDPHTYNIDPQQIERHVTPRTRAIIPVHLCGLPAEMSSIMEIASLHGLRVVEDSAETVLARHRGQAVGSFGDLGCFSTYVAHLLVTGVGGMVTTKDDDLAVLCRSLMAHGRDAIYLNIDDDDNLHDEALRRVVERRFSFVRMGYSYRCTELEAALGVAGLDEIDEIVATRQRNAHTLLERLRPYEDRLQLPSWAPHNDHAFMFFPIVTRPGIDRNPLVQHLEERGIETRYLMPLLNQPVCQRLFGDLLPLYPNARWITENGFYIACHQGLEAADLDYVADCFHDWFTD